MHIVTAFAMIAGGILLVVKGADYLVEGAGSIARRHRVKPIVIGLTIVAFGTSMPELVINLFASFQGAPGLAVGNVIGSNIANILLILGVASLVSALPVQKSTATRQIPFALLATVVLWFMVWDGVLSRADGLVLLAFFVIFIYYTFGIGRVEGQVEVVEKLSPPRAWALVAAGIIGLAVGGHLTVSGAKTVAAFMGVSDTVIGLTVVAIGTSLPELATSVVAAMKHEADIAIGNVVGSNIFNIFWVLGLSAVIRPLPFGPGSSFDVLVAVAATLILLLALYIGKKNILDRWEGAMFLLIYLAYLAFLIYANASPA